MTQGFDAGSLKERMAAFGSAEPRVDSLISLADAVRWICLRHDMAVHEATAFLLEDLWQEPSALTLYCVYAGERVRSMVSERIPMEPDAIIPSSSATHYRSPRDNFLADLRMATILGHAIGSSSHRVTEEAASVALVRADFMARYAIEPCAVVPEVADPCREPAQETVAQPVAQVPAVVRPRSAAQTKRNPQWTKAQLQTLVDAMQAEQHKEKRGALARLCRRQSKLLPDRSAVSRAAIQKALAEAEKQGISARGDAPRWPLFAAGKVRVRADSALPRRVHRLGD